MRSEGNGDPAVCMKNLLQITRGEVRLDILRGMDSTIIDLPESFVMARVVSEAYWLISNYEPRVDFNAVNIEGIAGTGNIGDFILNSTGNLE